MKRRKVLFSPFSHRILLHRWQYLFNHIFVVMLSLCALFSPFTPNSLFSLNSFIIIVIYPDHSCLLLFLFLLHHKNSAEYMDFLAHKFNAQSRVVFNWIKWHTQNGIHHGFMIVFFMFVSCLSFVVLLFRIDISPWVHFFNQTFIVDFMPFCRRLRNFKMRHYCWMHSQNLYWIQSINAKWCVQLDKNFNYCSGKFIIRIDLASAAFQSRTLSMDGASCLTSQIRPNFFFILLKSFRASFSEKIS